MAAATPFRTQKQSTHTTITLFGNHLIHDVTISATVGNYNWQTGTHIHKVIITHAQLHYFSRVYLKQTWSTKWPPYSLQYLRISVPLFSFTLNLLRSHTQAHEKKNLENYYKYLGNEEIYYIVKTCCIISIFSQNTINFILQPSSVQTILMFSINKAFKFIYQPGRLKVKYTFYISAKHFTWFLTL